MSEWASHNQELTRKTTEVLDRWTKAYEAKRISKREYFILVSGLYDATSGLIDMSVMNMMAEIHKELRKK